MPAGKEADEQFLDHLRLTDDDLRKLADDLLASVVQPANGRRLGNHCLNYIIAASAIRHWVQPSIGGIVAAAGCRASRKPVRSGKLRQGNRLGSDCSRL